MCARGSSCKIDFAAALLARRAVAFRMLAIAQGSCKCPIEALRVAAVEAERLKLRLEVDRPGAMRIELERLAD